MGIASNCYSLRPRPSPLELTLGCGTGIANADREWRGAQFGRLHCAGRG